MSTVIYPSPIFGPIHSRRLGVSLGINLMPADGKVCTFDCIYCECGFNADHRPTLPRPTREEVATALEAKLKEMAENGPKPDVLTFAGNGEPTAHPHFAEIIDDTIRLRDKYCPQAKVSVLSNNILKLDTVSIEYIKKVDHPQQPSYNVEDIIESLSAFKGHVIIQTMFMKGQTDGVDMSNVKEEYIEPWLKAVERIKPMEVMVYTIDRETPAKGLLKATHEELDGIRDRVIAMGIPCTASY